MKWLSGLFWFLFGGVFALTVAGLVTWEYLTSMGFVGAIAKGMIKRKAKKAIGLEKPKRRTSFSLRKRGIHSNR